MNAIPTPVAGSILDVDLTAGQASVLPSERYSDGVLGGAGMAISAMLERIPEGTRPFDPKNLMVFSAGLLVGTPAPGACRTHVAAMNALTGGYGAASAGGFFAPELKYAGFDAIFVSGRAVRPVYLFIEDGQVEIRDAGFLAGLTTGETEDAIHAAHDDASIQVLCIGPAGESMAAAATIIVSRFRSASRCGLGAVMGSKNLKAIAVRGSGSIRVAQPDSYVRLCGRLAGRLDDATTVKMLRRFGTPASFPQWNKIGNLPGRNYQTTTLSEAGAQALTPARLHKEAILRGFGCFACPIRCTQATRLSEGKFAGTRGEKLECQAFWDFGAKVGAESVAAVVKASALCGELGLDMNNASGAISWAMECHQRGLLSRDEAGGLDLSWGNEDTIVELLHQMARNTGLGALLKDGAKAAAARLGRGSEAFAMHVKGQDLAEEFRGLVGWALGIMVSERGGAHTTGAPLAERYSISPERSLELFGTEAAADPMSYEGKAELVVYYQRFHAAMEALGSCFFASNWLGADLLGPEDYLALINLACGTEMTREEFLTAGERIHTLQKLFNLRHTAHARADDVPQPRMFEVPESSRQFRIGLDRDRWEALLDSYYDLHGWDRTTTAPRRQALDALGLGQYAGIAERHGSRQAPLPA